MTYPGLIPLFVPLNQPPKPLVSGKSLPPPLGTTSVHNNAGETGKRSRSRGPDGDWFLARPGCRSRLSVHVHVLLHLGCFAEDGIWIKPTQYASVVMPATGILSLLLR